MSKTCNSPSREAFSRSLRVLVVDDFPINQEVICVYLREFGIKCIIATNGREAVDIVRASVEKERFDAILMDIQMPEMNGYDAVRLIRLIDEYRETPIVAVTSFAMDRDRQMCIEAGMDDHISKPIDFEVLKRVLEEQLKISIDSMDEEREEESLFGNWENEDPCDLPDELPGFDIEAGLTRMGQNKELYSKLLKGFQAEVETIWSKLKLGYELEDWFSVAMNAHSIKGIASNVGADQLAKVASDFEAMVEQGGRDLKDLYQQFEESFIYTSSAVLSWRMGGVVSNDVKNLNIGKFVTLLDELEKLIIESSFEVGTMAEELCNLANGSIFEAVVQELYDFLNDFDYASSEEKLSEIRDILREEAVSHE